MLPETRFSALPPHVRAAAHSVTGPRGFRAAGVAAGIKGSNRLDLGILLSDHPCVSTTLLTRNTAAAAPVLITESECDCARLRGVVVNSGNANACSGPTGLRDADRMRRLAALSRARPSERSPSARRGSSVYPCPCPRSNAASSTPPRRSPPRAASASRRRYAPPTGRPSTAPCAWRSVEARCAWALPPRARA